MRNVRLLLGAMAALVGLSSPPVRAQAPEAPTVMLVVDGSGSMWGKPEGEKLAKLYMARDALKALTAKAPPQTRVGLASFGHRRTGDCGDIEIQVKPEPLETEKLTPVLDKLNARGRGPITAALREAAKELGPHAAPASVILIHDDLDNCQQDPCSAIGDLRRAHPKVAVHVISLFMKKEDAARIACLPKGTGGKHYEVASQAQLTQALEETIQLASADSSSPPKPGAKGQPPARAPVAIAPESKPGLLLTASLAAGQEPIDLPVRWRLTKSGDASGPVVWEGDEVAPLIDLPTGRYDVEAWLGFVKIKGSVDAVAGQRRTLALPLGAGTIKFGPLSPKSASVMRDALITFRKVDAASSEAMAVQRGAEAEVALVAGSYIVSVALGSLRIDRGLTLKPGDRLAFQPPLNFGELTLSAVPASGAAADADATFTLFEDDPDAPQGRREIARSSATSPRFTLPSGTYYVVARSGSAEARERVTVRSGESEARVLVLDAAQVTLAVKLPGGRIDLNDRVSHRLERLGAETRDVLHASRPTALLKVAAGRYRLETRIGLGNVLLEREIELKAGAREQVAIEPPAGLLVLRLVDASGVNALPDVAWDIRDAKGKLVWISNQTEARPLLLAGRYTVTGTARNRRGERMVEVRAGDVRSYDLPSQ